MSSTSQPVDFSDLYTDLMNRTREDTGTSATIVQAKRYINTALQDMHLGQGEKFPWAERTAILNTAGQYSTGTVSIDQGSTALAGTGTTWLSDNGMGRCLVHPYGKFVINGTDEVYRLSNAVGTSSLTLMDTYIGDDVTDGSYLYFEDEYLLADDFLRPIDQQKFDSAGSIDLVGRTEFRRRYPANKVPGKPAIAMLGYRPFVAEATGAITSASSWASGIVFYSLGNGLSTGDIIEVTDTSYLDGTYYVVSATNLAINVFGTYTAGGDQTGTFTRARTQTRTIHFHPPPSEIEMIRYQYVTANLGVTSAGVEQTGLSSDDDEPIVPIQYRHAIVYHALYNWYRDKKDDARSQEALNEYTKIMLRVIADTEIGGARAQLRPRVGVYRRRAKSPWSGGSRRYDLNGKFDRLEW